MNSFIWAHVAPLRLGCFFGILLFITLWKVIAPRRELTTAKRACWFTNLGLVASDTLTLRLLLPMQAAGMALSAVNHGWGILNSAILPQWFRITICVLGLDLVIYLQHVIFHVMPLFWRFHRAHHTDLDFDVTTGVRFHPVEIFLSMGIKMTAVVLLGASAAAVILSEVLLNATSMFNHGNVLLPGRIDGVLRLLVVTPDMHRVHHSMVIQEHNSNFGFNLPWWDRLFGTYCPQPAAGHEGMTIGLSHYRDAHFLTFPRLLIFPFITKPTH